MAKPIPMTMAAAMVNPTSMRTQQPATLKLAEYSADKDSIVTSWTTFTLDKLGSVDKVDFELQSSKEGIPSSFCMDNFTAQVHLKY